MEVAACRRCRTLFNYFGGNRLCPACRDELEKKFTDVKRYIEDHKNATINVVAQEMEVSVQQINQWIREERLAFSDDSPVTISCETCGKQIRTGRYCDSCKASLTRDLQNVYRKATPMPVANKDKEHDKMRFLNK